MDKQVFKCECGYTTHFEKALTAHCKFRHHHPAKEAETILPDVAEEVTKAVKKIKAEDERPKKKTTTRKPRAKKTAVKE